MEKPLAELLRPTSLDEVVGQHHLLDKGKVMRNVIESNKITNMIFYGAPGIGKTTLAKIIAEKTNMSLHMLNGTTANIDDIKQIIAGKIRPCNASIIPNTPDEKPKYVNNTV